MGNKLNQFFHMKERGTNVKTEILAGLTTFLTCVYIVAVNPGILAAAGMDNCTFRCDCLYLDRRLGKSSVCIGTGDGTKRLFCILCL